MQWWLNRSSRYNYETSLVLRYSRRSRRFWILTFNAISVVLDIRSTKYSQEIALLRNLSWLILLAVWHIILSIVIMRGSIVHFQDAFSRLLAIHTERIFQLLSSTRSSYILWLSLPSWSRLHRSSLVFQLLQKIREWKLFVMGLKIRKFI